MLQIIVSDTISENNIGAPKMQKNVYKKALILTFHTRLFITNNLCEFTALENKLKW